MDTLLSAHKKKEKKTGKTKEKRDPHLKKQKKKHTPPPPNPQHKTAPSLELNYARGKRGSKSEKKDPRREVQGAARGWRNEGKNFGGGGLVKGGSGEEVGKLAK